MTHQNPDTDDVYREYSWESTPASTAIIESVNTFERENTDTGLDDTRTPLYDFIDVEALNALITSATEFTLSFTYTGYTIQIDSEGVRVSPD